MSNKSKCMCFYFAVGSFVFQLNNDFFVQVKRRRNGAQIHVCRSSNCGAVNEELGHKCVYSDGEWMQFYVHFTHMRFYALQSQRMTSIWHTHARTQTHSKRKESREKTRDSEREWKNTTLKWFWCCCCCRCLLYFLLFWLVLYFNCKFIVYDHAVVAFCDYLKFEYVSVPPGMHTYSTVCATWYIQYVIHSLIVSLLNKC